MPAVSKAQFRMMQAAAHSRPGKAKKSPVSREVAQKFLGDGSADYAKLPERTKPK